MVHGIPWWAKMGAKMLLSRLPFNYRSWRKIGIFKHGCMTDPKYALDVFIKHYNRAHLSRKCSEFSCLELGPGDSLYSIPIAHAFGARSCYLVDSGDYASDDFSGFGRLLSAISPTIPQAEPIIDELAACRDWSDVLTKCNSSYLTHGITSLKLIPDESVDLIWSNAVLEHVRKNEFLETMKQLFRILRQDGICSHTVDLRDHFNMQLNSLRFPESIWESTFFIESGFYTNRIRCSTMLDLFREAGFVVESVNCNRWNTLPISRKKLNSAFSSLSYDDLLTYGFDISLKKAT